MNENINISLEDRICPDCNNILVGNNVTDIFSNGIIHNTCQECGCIWEYKPITIIEKGMIK